jgi:hypothetical protein
VARHYAAQHGKKPREAAMTDDASSDDGHVVRVFIPGLGNASGANEYWFAAVAQPEAAEKAVRQVGKIMEESDGEKAANVKVVDNKKATVEAVAPLPASVQKALGMKAGDVRKLVFWRSVTETLTE